MKKMNKSGRAAIILLTTLLLAVILLVLVCSHVVDFSDYDIEKIVEAADGHILSEAVSLVGDDAIMTAIGTEKNLPEDANNYYIFAADDKLSIDIYPIDTGKIEEIKSLRKYSDLKSIKERKSIIFVDSAKRVDEIKDDDIVWLEKKYDEDKDGVIILYIKSGIVTSNIVIRFKKESGNPFSEQIDLGKKHNEKQRNSVSLSGEQNLVVATVFVDNCEVEDYEIVLGQGSTTGSYDPDTKVLTEGVYEIKFPKTIVKTEFAITE